MYNTSNQNSNFPNILKLADAGKTERATKRINDGDGGLAKHASTYPHEVDSEHAKIVEKEQGWTQRKYLEGIETPLTSPQQL